MAERLQVYKCTDCGIVVEVLTGGKCDPACCDKTMELGDHELIIHCQLTEGATPRFVEPIYEPPKTGQEMMERMLDCSDCPQAPKDGPYPDPAWISGWYFYSGEEPPAQWGLADLLGSGGE